MNPLRQENGQISTSIGMDQPARSSCGLPLKLSLAPLQAEIFEPQIRQQAAASPFEKEADKNDIQVDFWAAWHSHRDYLFRLSMLWMNVSAADAEDAFSDATVRAYEKYKAHADQISNERAWFARLLHNICIDKHRANKRLKNLYEKVKEIGDIDNSALENRQLTPEGSLLNSELGRILNRAINNLPERLKAPVVLRLVQGEEYDDIARALGITNDNARKRVQQARLILRESLAVLTE
ncbi:MAG: sigma-70 family RNA polymerase sigma factor [Sneathiella sp.]|nr:sigma-70 family RNA polymerase sigma factor [Sneathiella sp.]